MRETPGKVYEYGVLKGDHVGPVLLKMTWGEHGATDILLNGKPVEANAFMAAYPNPCDLLRVK